MNYRHSYHAGNFADVLKHIVLVRALIHMTRKEAPFRMIDTHAGQGMYDLAGVQAEKTGEWREGIARLLDAAPLDEALADLVAPYLDLVKPLLSTRKYPGSPWLARELTRPTDRLVAVEKHPEDGKRLKRVMGRADRLDVRVADGYATLAALLPPVERRALILVDPPFEDPREDRMMVEAFAAAYRRFATGTYLFWYPTKGRREADQFARRFAAIQAPKTYRVELILHAVERVDRLNGCGLILVNPPWPLMEEMPRLVSGLARILGKDGAARGIVETLVPEK